MLLRVDIAKEDGTYLDDEAIKAVALKIGEACGNCKFWQPFELANWGKALDLRDNGMHQQVVWDGNCCRYPPMHHAIVDDGDEWSYPVTGASQWCGEFKRENHNE